MSVGPAVSVGRAMLVGPAMLVGRAVSVGRAVVVGRAEPWSRGAGRCREPNDVAVPSEAVSLRRARNSGSSLGAPGLGACARHPGRNHKGPRTPSASSINTGVCVARLPSANIAAHLSLDSRGALRPARVRVRPSTRRPQTRQGDPGTGRAGPDRRTHAHDAQLSTDLRSTPTAPGRDRTARRADRRHDARLGVCAAGPEAGPRGSGSAPTDPRQGHAARGLRQSSEAGPCGSECAPT